MSEPFVWDYAIVGAGVSGLTLAWMLGESALADRSILLVDGLRDDDELKTLSFWTSAPLPLDPIVAHRWRRLRFATAEKTTELALEEHGYQTLFFADLQRETKRRLAERPANRVIDGRLDRIVEDDDGATLFVADARLRARWVFDSRFHRRELRGAASGRAPLEQHFHGWVVHTEHDAFEPAVATWLDFRADAEPGTVFFYVLPFSAREALVELVALRPIDAAPLLRTYLERHHGISTFRIEDQEAGVSPMTTEQLPWRWRRTRRIGVAAGRLKPSTGYALTRIVEDSRRIIASLERDGHPLVAPTHALRFALLDALLLEVWRESPAAIPDVFAALLADNPIDRVLAFLDERATLREIVTLGMSLPKGPFLRALARSLAAALDA